MPPLVVGNQLATDFLVKANFFNDYFSKQCATIGNNSSIPANIAFETEERLSTFEICSDDILKIKSSLNLKQGSLTQWNLYPYDQNIHFFNFRTTGDSL